MIYIGADHRGFELKEKLKSYLDGLGLAYEDVGAHAYNAGDDFVDFATDAGRKVAQSSEENRAILICRNAVGMDVVANKIRGARSAIGFNVEQVRLARNDDDVNVLALASDFIDEALARELVNVFIKTDYEGHERQERRLAKIKAIENE